MQDILSSLILSDIKNHYLARVTNAALGYKYNEGDEDSLTGALGQSLLTTTPRIVYDANGIGYLWSTYHYKIRGRGIFAPEKEFGADGIFQIEIRGIRGNLLRRKGFLFQAKKKWNGVDSKLKEQAALLSSNPHKAIVVDYSPNGYKACLAIHAAKANGDRHKLKSRQFRRLADLLGNDFLDCHIGLTDLYYDSDKEILFDPIEGPRSRFKDNAQVVSTNVQLIR